MAIDEHKDGPVRWVDKGAFVMEVLPESLEIDPLLASLLHCMAFLELSSGDTVDPDWAVEAMEHVSHYLQRLVPPQQAEIEAQLRRVVEFSRSRSLSPAFVEFAEKFLVNAGVGEEPA